MPSIRLSIPDTDNPSSPIHYKSNESLKAPSFTAITPAWLSSTEKCSPVSEGYTPLSPEKTRSFLEGNFSPTHKFKTLNPPDRFSVGSILYAMKARSSRVISRIRLRIFKLSTTAMISTLFGLLAALLWIWFYLNTGPGLGRVVNGVFFMLFVFGNGLICIKCGNRARRMVLPAVVSFSFALSIALIGSRLLGWNAEDRAEGRMRIDNNLAECTNCYESMTPDIAYRYGFFLCSIKGWCDGYGTGPMNTFSSDAWSQNYDMLWDCTDGSDDYGLIKNCTQQICIGNYTITPSTADHKENPYKWAHFKWCAYKVGMKAQERSQLLFIHALFGFIALVIGFVQMIGRVNVCLCREVIARGSPWHKIFGLIYIVSALACCISGFTMGYMLALPLDIMMCLLTYLTWNVVTIILGMGALVFKKPKWHDRFMKANYFIMWGTMTLRTTYLIMFGMRYINWADEDPYAGIDEETFMSTMFYIHLWPVVIMASVAGLYVVLDKKTYGRLVTFTTQFDIRGNKDLDKDLELDEYPQSTYI